MNTNVINLSNSNNFVSNEYLQSKLLFDELSGANRPIDETTPIPQILPNNNPFSIYNS